MNRRSSRATGCRTRYRQNLIRQIGQHAHSEVVGMLPEAMDLPGAQPAPERSCWPRWDEAGHGCTCTVLPRPSAWAATSDRRLLTGKPSTAASSTTLPLLGGHRGHRLAGGRAAIMNQVM